MGGDMKGRIVSYSVIPMSRRGLVTFELCGDFGGTYDALKDVDIDLAVKKWREKRSLSANAYFHVLVNKIAENQGLSDDEVKANLVMEYGALAKDDAGQTVGFKLPATVDVGTIYPYCRCFDIRYENGIAFRCYLVYKQTHLMDSKEMSRLIDGAVYEARNLGIETDTPEQIAKYKALWAAEEQAR